jgi:uncharacterized membrane protein
MTATDPARRLRVVLGTAFTGAGIAHVIKHQWFENLVPASVARWRKPISVVTAAMQIVGGMAMFVPQGRVLARWVNLAMLVPTLPAAVAQINSPEVLRQAGIPPALAPVRVVAQTVVAALTWCATRSATGRAGD